MPEKPNMNNGCIDAICCSVNNCEYNCEKKCHAKKIDIGPNFAVSNADTVCSTFKTK